MSAPQCEALIAGRLWNDQQCSRRARNQRENRPLCAQHVKIYDKWKAKSPKHADQMAALFWGWR